MSLVSPNNGRAVIDDNGFETRITIPSKKRIFIVLFMCAWLGGWFMGESSVISILFRAKTGGADAFLLFWLCGWTLGGIFVIYNILWNIAGKEIITCTPDLLKIENKVFGIGISKEYLPLEVKSFRVDIEECWQSTFGTRNRSRFGGFRGGNIVFDYGMKTIRFARDVDEAEANHLIEIIQGRYSHLPLLDTKAEKYIS
ncbi:MAG TPA: hypothetical protein VF941_18680 [Clostridia bacterium]